MAHPTSTKRAKRILILCRAVFGPRMSSPGIRARHMAEVLSAELPDAHVTLGIPGSGRASHETATDSDDAGLPYTISPFTLKSLPGLLWSHDVIIANDFPPLAILAFPWKKFVLDYYTIYFIEWMENSRDTLGESKGKRSAFMSGARRRIGAELLYSDLLVCANDRQKDYYIGASIGLGLIDPASYDVDPGMHRLIEPAPHGIRPDALVKTGGPVLKGVYAGIRETDKLIIWNGGILQWYDPLTLLRALARIKEHRDDVKLVFVGGAYPGLGLMGLGRRFQETVDLAKELGLYNNTIFFDMTWVPYDKIKDYMLEADLSVCTYFDNLETHFSLRTRFVDVFWAELPLICTAGDVFADMVRDRGLGIVVPQEDIGAVAGAIEKLLDDREFYEQCKTNIRENNVRMAWNVSLQPIVDFCKNPKSSALPKWRRSVLLAGAWGQWFVARAIGVWMR